MIPREEPAGPRPVLQPRPRQATLLLLVIFLLLLTAGLAVQSWNLHIGLLATEIGLIALPTLAACRLGGFRPSTTLAMGSPRPPGWGFSLRFAAGLGPLASLTAMALSLPFVLLLIVLGGSYRGVDLPLSGTANVAWTLAIATIVAPACEELLFRGFLLRAFLPFGWHAAVWLSAVAFGLFHMDPVRFVPTALLGLVFGYLAAGSGSIFPSVVAHMVNNGLVLMVAVVFGGASGTDSAAPAGASYEVMRAQILERLSASGVGTGGWDPDWIVRATLLAVSIGFLAAGLLLATCLALLLRFYVGQFGKAGPLTRSPAGGGPAAHGPAAHGPLDRGAPAVAPAAVPSMAVSRLARDPAAWALVVIVCIVWIRLLSLYFGS